tara:strand:- start:3527 stop:3742 length:216 start_codon:yes stop_codon:yes gene_type:complete
MKHKLSNIFDMLLFFMVLVFISTLYIISQWPYTPEDAIRQGSKLGSYAIAIDLIILGIFVYLWFRKKDNAE